jgi:rubrerythrin
MKRTTVVQVVAAILVVLGGLAFVFAEERRIEVRVEANDGNQAIVMINGERHEVSIGDLAEGEQRTFTAGEHTVTVQRVGEELTVNLDGHGLGKPGCAHSEKMVWVGEEGEHAEHVMVHEGDGAKVHKKVVIVTGDDAEGAGYRFETGGEGEDVKVIRVDDALEVVSERVTFRCSEDGTTLRIAKDKATQSSYTCPVCGRVMEKAEAPEVRVMTWVSEDDEKGPPETE